jgi:adenylate cyclase
MSLKQNIARLLFATAEGAQSVELRPRNTLGRDPKNSIPLLDKIVGKEHCVIELRGNGWFLKDLGSLNGTYVSGDRVQGERALRQGDEIALGATRLRFDDGSTELTASGLAICPGIARSPFAGAFPFAGNKPN